MSSQTPYSIAHRLYVKSLYKRFLTNSLNWYIRRDLWRNKAIEIRAEFERNRNITDPRALALVLEQAEARLAKEAHPDPYRPPLFPDGTKWYVVSFTLSSLLIPLCIPIPL
ncbi:NADH dehydrogenase (ubiquinone) 1 beta subcomplex 9 [Tremella mesenterica]|uniref:NADH dehydrogenase [ubiquinone] 1 beta subcomplex subunit 9 n=1 Tax=Tremella mesenterica TaxID=5217 RepID=A0A4Q1BC32_TREME|nr:NADH dehydrogenase (ubiquinone) 1 beta subcomplex 9 [Tremella mesenterica]